MKRTDGQKILQETVGAVFSCLQVYIFFGLLFLQFSFPFVFTIFLLSKSFKKQRNVSVSKQTDVYYGLS